MTGTDHTGKAGSGGELHMQAMSFPTPTAKDADGSRDTSARPGSKRNPGKTLTDATMSLWQTPGTDSFRSRGGERVDEEGLDQQARAWPTPRVRSTLGDSASPERLKEGPCPGLNDAAKSWATPTSSDLSTPREQTDGGRSLVSDVDKWPTPMVHDQTGGRGKNNMYGDGHYRPHDLVDAVKTWPTPRAEDSESAGNHPDATDSLTGATKNWPTPVANPEAPNLSSNQKSSPASLGAAAEKWPTPNASLMNDGESPESFKKRATRLEEKHNNTNGAGMPLAVAAASWPTPTAMDSEDAGNRPGREGTGDGLVKASQAWPTPNSRDHKGSDLKTRNGGASLSHFAETGERTHGSPPSSPQVPVISAHGGELSPTDPSTASRRRLNPAFVCWLMGWPWWWTNPGEISFARQATASYLSRLRTLLSSLLGGRASSTEERTWATPVATDGKSPTMTTKGGRSLVLDAQRFGDQT